VPRGGVTRWRSVHAVSAVQAIQADPVTGRSGSLGNPGSLVGPAALPGPAGAPTYAHEPVSPRPSGVPGEAGPTGPTKVPYIGVDVMRLDRLCNDGLKGTVPPLLSDEHTRLSVGPRLQTWTLRPLAAQTGSLRTERPGEGEGHMKSELKSGMGTWRRIAPDDRSTLPSGSPLLLECLTALASSSSSLDISS
jgi:hypothetical protein